MSTLSVSSAYYASSVADFLTESRESILGALASNSGSIEASQRDAWLTEIEVLKRALEGLEGTLFLEFVVPRVGSRIDAVVVSGSTVFVIEFKVGEREFRTHDYDQAWDHALDLKNFHLASHAAPILPILVPTEAEHRELEARARRTTWSLPPCDATRSTWRWQFDALPET
ncbi:MAG: hypothetical protein ABI609_00535 [Acidobacteriota bacterium]